MYERLSQNKLFWIGALLVSTMAWGATFIFVKWTIEEIDPYHFLFTRFLIALIILLLLFHRKLRQLRADTIFTGIFLGLIFFIAYATQTVGLQITTASNSALITGLYMVLVPLFLIFLKKRVDPLAFAGAVCSFIGLYMLTNYSFSGINTGDLLTLVCAFCWAVHIIIVGRVTHHHPGPLLVIIQIAVVTILSGAMTFARGGFVLHMSPLAWGTILVCAIFATVVAFLVQVMAQRVIDPTRIGIIFSLEAVFGAFFAWLVGGEILTFLALIGAVLMCLGMAISESGPAARYLLDKISN
jgi:drug/metabolite transporter (DMT)-like permease